VGTWSRAGSGAGSRAALRCPGKLCESPQLLNSLGIIPEHRGISREGSVEVTYSNTALDTHAVQPCHVQWRILECTLVTCKHKQNEGLLDPDSAVVACHSNLDLLARANEALDKIAK
jgi:hypothetical protein